MSDELLQQAISVRNNRILARKRRYRRSRLDRFRAEIMKLVDAGYSHRDIAAWLRRYQRVRISHTTIGRAIKRWNTAVAAASNKQFRERDHNA